MFARGWGSPRSRHAAADDSRVVADGQRAAIEPTEDHFDGSLQDTRFLQYRGQWGWSCVWLCAALGGLTCGCVLTDGRSMAAAFALGAEGVQMGTRFLASAESPVHDNYKQLVVSTPETGTVMLNRFHKPGYRVLATRFSEQYEESAEMVTLGQRGNILDLYFGGDLTAAFAFGGQVAGRIEEVRPVAEIIAETIEEFHDTIRALGKFGEA